MLYYFINGLIGAFIAILISYIGKTNLYMLAGLIPLFPTFALFAQVSAYQIGGEQQVKDVIFFGMLAMIPYLLYMLSFYFSLTQNIKFLHAGFLSYLANRFIGN